MQIMVISETSLEEIVHKIQSKVQLQPTLLSKQFFKIVKVYKSITIPVFGTSCKRAQPL